MAAAEAMPEIPLTRVVSVTSSDPRHPAENLLRPDDGGRWRGAAAGEKQLSVVLELGGSPRPIHSLHIGNDGAAFVEVLAGTAAGGEFQVLLPTAALMSPSESRAGAELRRVRIFGPESLVKSSAKGAWDRIRVVLTQPYCQSRPFGLSFVRVFAAPEEEKSSPEGQVRRLGPFTLREEEGEGQSSPRPPGASFYRPSPTPDSAQSSPGPSYALAALGVKPKRLAPPKPRGSPPRKQPRPPWPKRLAPPKPRGSPPRKQPRPPWALNFGNPKNSQTEPKNSHPNPKNSDPNFKNSDPNPKNSDPNLKNFDPNSKNFDSNPKNFDLNSKNSDSNPKNFDPKSKNLDLNSKNLDSNLKNFELKSKNSDPNPKNFDLNSKNSDPNPKNSQTEPKNSSPNSKNSAPNSAKKSTPNSKNFGNSAKNSTLNFGNLGKNSAQNPKNSTQNPKNSTPNPQKFPKNPPNSSRNSSPKSKNAQNSQNSPKNPRNSPILGGVVLALSGFQNPLRSQLRAAAAAMGAQYRPLWGPDCTHLVCAFSRTPKAAQARQLGGVLVGPEWIWECQRRGRRLPCGPYLLDGSASSDSEGEEPEDAPPPSPSMEEGAEPVEIDSPVTPPPAAPATRPESGDSDGQSDSDPYGGSTEENSEDEEGEGLPIPPLPDFFQDKTFFFHGEFAAGEERRLRRFAVAFGGTLAPYMDDSVTHVVTTQDWDPAFDQALELRPSLTFVRPHWLLLCGERQRPLPAAPFAVVPRA